jgi:hypothetical protein
VITAGCTRPAARTVNVAGTWAFVGGGLAFADSVVVVVVVVV